MTRILALSNLFPPHHYGGYELGCRDVLGRLAERGHQTAVLTSSWRVRGVADPPGKRAAGVRRDLRLYWHDHQLVSPPPLARLAIERRNQRALAGVLAAYRPEVVSVWNMGAMSLGLLTTLARRRVPLVYVVQDDWLDYGPRLDAWTRLFRQRPALGRLVARLTGVPTLLPDLGTTGAFCFCSAATREHARSRTGFSFPRSTVVYNGIDARAFAPPGDAQAGRGRWCWRLLYVGRLDPRKGIDTAIRALARLPAQARLTVAGGGDSSHREQLRALAAERGVADRLSFTSVERSALAALYADADVCVVPSRWAEPFGLVPVEAMACDTPVVATATGGSAEFLHDGVNCLCFPPDDEAGLAAALTRLAGDARLRDRLVEGGRRTAAELTVDRLADVLEEWHVAAAAGYPNGLPADRRLPGSWKLS